jgi:phage regulator Rha-like protein
MAKAKVSQKTFNDLVEIRGQSAFSATLAVASGCEIAHQSALKLVRKYRSEFEELGFLGFQIQEKRGTQGAPTEYAELNEDQATFLITLFRNTPIVLRFKLRLVQAFRQALNEIKRLYADPPRRDLAAEKRAAHNPMMDALVECRELLGKVTATHHFANENRLCNGIVTGDFKGANEKALTNEELALLAKIRRRNESMLHVGFEYAERKKLLTEFAIRERTKQISRSAAQPRLEACAA